MPTIMHLEAYLTLGETVPIPRELARELSPSKYQEEFAEEYWQDWCGMLDSGL
jgi:hypothetical protein